MALAGNNAALEFLTAAERDALRSRPAEDPNRRVVDAALQIIGLHGWTGNVDAAAVADLRSAVDEHPGIKRSDLSAQLATSAGRPDPLSAVVNEILSTTEFSASDLLARFEKELGQRGLTTYYALLNDRGPAHTTVKTSRTQRLINEYGEQFERIFASRFAGSVLRTPDERLRPLGRPNGFLQGYEQLRGISHASRSRHHLPAPTPPGIERQHVERRPAPEQPRFIPGRPSHALEGRLSSPVLTDTEAEVFFGDETKTPMTPATQRVMKSLVALGDAANTPSTEAFAIAARSLARKLADHTKLVIAPYGPVLDKPDGVLEIAINDVLREPALAQEVVGVVFEREMGERLQMPTGTSTGEMRERTIEMFIADVRHDPDAAGLSNGVQQRVDLLSSAFVNAGRRTASERLRNLPIGIALEATAPRSPEHFVGRVEADSRERVSIGIEAPTVLLRDGERITEPGHLAAFYEDFLADRDGKTLDAWLVNETSGRFDTATIESIELAGLSR
jgi:hypothetical protein